MILFTKNPKFKKKNIFFFFLGGGGTKVSVNIFLLRIQI